MSRAWRYRPRSARAVHPPRPGTPGRRPASPVTHLQMTVGPRPDPYRCRTASWQGATLLSRGARHRTARPDARHDPTGRLPRPDRADSGGCRPPLPMAALTPSHGPRRTVKTPTNRRSAPGRASKPTRMFAAPAPPAATSSAPVANGPPLCPLHGAMLPDGAALVVETVEVD